MPSTLSLPLSAKAALRVPTNVEERQLILTRRVRKHQLLDGIPENMLGVLPRGVLAARHENKILDIRALESEGPDPLSQHRKQPALLFRQRGEVVIQVRRTQAYKRETRASQAQT